MAQSEPESHNKPCTICGTPRGVLVRCTIDESQKWNMVCPGSCWRSVSGGVDDAKGLEGQYPHYRYGGMWKNKHADGPVSAKKPGKVKRRQREERAQREGEQQNTHENAEGGQE
ncbi:hypothetical protein AC579_7972 [Pseudocercospora musae]|uniref:Uncharacterized protein n=1 Tax=Pseudocercospora musae TaxID=113226 RepID=A0A139IBN5_9PEZI|nr:hypothetical protein AC579_7972 [Pseudocercospora musae]